MMTLNGALSLLTLRNSLAVARPPYICPDPLLTNSPVCISVFFFIVSSSSLFNNCTVYGSICITREARE